MGMDKGLLCYRGQTSEIERWQAHFETLDLPFYWSQRPEQYPADLFPHITRLMDQSPGSGPLGALISAHRSRPQHAWLVLACDWPLLGLEDLRYLLEQRHPESDATCYVHEGRRQPLCCLYEPKFLQKAEIAWNRGEQSLQRLLQAAVVWEVQVGDETTFLNVNDPIMRQEVETRIRTAPSPHRPHRSAH
jgi:molybdopterin-guanine dinucleotide biosynthesis protein A